MKATLENKEEVAKGTLWLRFKLFGKIKFRPGQTFVITLPKLLYPDKRGSTRHFSIVNSSFKNNIIEMTTRLRDTGFKKTLMEMSIGEDVEIRSISGIFTLPQDTKTPLVFLAGGIGITPFMSMLNYLNDSKKFPYNIALIYSNRDQESTPFLKELKKFAKNHRNFKLILTMTQDSNWKGEKRKISGAFLKDYLKNLNRYQFMVAGPCRFKKAMVNILENAVEDMSRIKAEEFTGY